MTINIYILTFIAFQIQNSEFSILLIQNISKNVNTNTFTKGEQFAIIYVLTGNA